MTAVLRMAMILTVGLAGLRAQASTELLLMEYSHRVVLDPDGVYVMLWTPGEHSIDIEVQVETKGYIGLGFSPNGGMRDADIVLGWVDAAGKVILHDRYAEGNFAPTVDESQDVKLLGGYQNDTHTVLKFSRSWETLDTSKDYMLGEDTVRVIWAYSNNDPASETALSYHEARGTKSLYLRSPQLKVPPMDSDIKTWDFLTSNVSLPSSLDTLYWCQMLKIPNITTKHHIIGYTPVLQSENLQYVHHIVLYECTVPEAEHHFEKWVDWEGTQCYSANMPPSWKFCNSALFAWAVGGEGEMFPEHVGFPMGERGTDTYFLMEMHYDNPNYRQGVVDRSGIRMFYTDQLRQYDAGTMMFGHGLTPYHIIPPVLKWQSSGYCDTSCTRQHLPQGGVHLFQGLLHSHLLGNTLILRHGRNGQELPPVMSDMNYDFNYQNTRIMKEEVTILPGDSLILDCGYNPSQRSGPTFGGLGTNEEMCVGFMSYYPRIDLSFCGSQPELDTVLNALGIEEADKKEYVDDILTPKKELDVEAENQLQEQMMIGNLSNEAEPMIIGHLLHSINVTAPQKYFNRSLYSILEDRATWMDERVTVTLQKAVLEGNHFAVCHLRSEGPYRKSDNIITAPNLKPLPQSLPDVSFKHSIVLDQEGSYVMLWTPRKDDIVFEIQVGTTGYVGLGFSPTGGMKGADIVLGWVDDDGKVFLQDQYAEDHSAPMLDKSQDVELLGGYQNDTHTVLRFSRPWNTCDEGFDYILSDDTVRVIWAYSFRDPAGNNDLHYHDKRGTKSIYLQSPQFELPPMGPDVKTWDFLSPNVSLPDNLDTLYWCKVFKMPHTPVKSHMIGYIPIVHDKNAEHVHHFIFYECYVPNSDTHFEQWLDWKGAQCYSANMPVSWKYCKSILIAWAIGGEGEMFPEHAGFPIGEEHGGATYFMMEIHYDNPNLRQGVVDSSGIRIFYTESLRESDAGVLMIGHEVSPLHIIPPNQTRFLTGSFCDSSCTEESLPREGVKLFQGLLHSHLLGTSLVVRHIRNGKELPLIIKDMKYDFNYQSTRVFKEEITLLPGDILITECFYNSSSRNKPTLGGLGTQEEMCLAFLSYYPRVNLFSCFSQPQMKDILSPLGVKNVLYDKTAREFQKRFEAGSTDGSTQAETAEKTKNNDMKQGLKPIKFSDFHRALTITAPEKYLNMSVYDILYDEATWQEHKVTDSFQKMTTSGVHQSKCEMRGNKVAVVKKLIPYPSFRTRRQRDHQCFHSKGGNSWTGNGLCPPAFPFC